LAIKIISIVPSWGTVGWNMFCMWGKDLLLNNRVVSGHPLGNLLAIPVYDHITPSHIEYIYWYLKVIKVNFTRVAKNKKMFYCIKIPIFFFFNCLVNIHVPCKIGNSVNRIWYYIVICMMSHDLCTTIHNMLNFFVINITLKLNCFIFDN